MNYRSLYEKGKGTLAGAEIQEAELDARLLLEFACDTDRNTLLVHGDREVSAQEEESYLELIERRAKRIPLQHLTGVQDFMGLEFAVNEHVLIPRQDTEILVEEALQNLHDGMRVLDMCTGSGCILISLLHYTNDCQGVGADISAEALQVAKANATKLLGEQAMAERQVMPEKQTETVEQDLPGEPGVGKYISFVQSDLFENVAGEFDMIVSNPPYIESEVVETLMPEVRDHEPRLALDGRSDGLYFYREIVTKSKNCLAKGGMLLFEIGYNQGEAVSELMRQAGFLEVQVIKDYGGLDRVVCGTLGFELSGM